MKMQMDTSTVEILRCKCYNPCKGSVSGSERIQSDLQSANPKNLQGGRQVSTRPKGFVCMASGSAVYSQRLTLMLTVTMCVVDWIANGTVYLLGGKISKGRLRLHRCGPIEEWSQVTPAQRVGIRRVYGRNCECQIPPCDWNGCGKLKGCTDFRSDECK
ncbi:uncharacterized protein LOC144639770 [Oculina patagonica]